MNRQLSLSGYLAPSADPFAHFRIVCGSTYPRFDKLSCLLARVWPNGNFELLSPAWSVLGYSTQDLAGRYVCELVALDRHAAYAAVASLLTEGGVLCFGLLCKNGRETRYRWIREFDDYRPSMFVLGEELPAAGGPATVALSERRACFTSS